MCVSLVRCDGLEALHFPRGIVNSLKIDGCECLEGVNLSPTGTPPAATNVAWSVCGDEGLPDTADDDDDDSAWSSVWIYKCAGLRTVSLPVVTVGGVDSKDRPAGEDRLSELSVLSCPKLRYCDPSPCSALERLWIDECDELASLPLPATPTLVKLKVPPHLEPSLPTHAPHRRQPPP